MNTRYLQFNERDLTLAGELIRRGELVAFPTETVYGLGANAWDEQAVRRTYEAKGRPSDNPLIVHVYDKAQIGEVASLVSDAAAIVIDKVMPAPITVVLPKRSCISDVITAGMDTVAVRMPLSLQARAFLRAADVPVTAPSANLSGRPSPTTWQCVREDMDGRVAAVMCGDPCQVGIESTVLDLTRDDPVILRAGAVGAEYLSRLLGRTVTVLNDPKSKVNSPGVRYKHYAPSVPMALDLSDDEKKMCAFYDARAAEGYHPLIWARRAERFGSRRVLDMELEDSGVARSLFNNLRTAERTCDYLVAGYSAECADSEISVGIIDRLKRACGHNLI